MYFSPTSQWLRLSVFPCMSQWEVVVIHEGLCDSLFVLPSVDELINLPENLADGLLSKFTNGQLEILSLLILVLASFCTEDSEEVIHADACRIT